MQTIKVETGGERLDIFLARYFGGTHTRSQLTNAIKGAKITLNGQKAKSGETLRAGDIIEIGSLDAEITHDIAEQLPLDIVYEDAHLLIINKPRGMVVHPGAGNRRGTLLNALLGHADNDPSLERAGIVHRLDKNTAGLMLAAKTPAAQAKLCEMFVRHEVNRTYMGLVEGVLDTNGTVNANIARDERNRTLYKTVMGKGRRAITHYRVIQQFPRHTLAEFTLETGRTHQIRVHCKSIGHPIVGDPEYNPKSSIAARGQLLESVRLEFIHPITHARIVREIPLTAEFSGIIAKLQTKSPSV